MTADRYFSSSRPPWMGSTMRARKSTATAYARACGQGQQYKTEVLRTA